MSAASSTAGLFEFALSRTFDRLEGLVDAEYLWEPVEGAWSIRVQPDGSWAPDWEWPEPDPPKVTTIAWRLWHLGADPVPGLARADLSSGRAMIDSWFAQMSPASLAPAGTAADAIALLHAAWDDVPAKIRALGDDECAVVIEDGPYAGATALDLLLHIADEVIHHAAEVGVLRDLWCAGAATGG